MTMGAAIHRRPEEGGLPSQNSCGLVEAGAPKLWDVSWCVNPLAGIVMATEYDSYWMSTNLT